MNHKEEFKKELDNIGMPILWDGFESKKIIGNIFENPELMNEDK